MVDHNEEIELLGGYIPVYSRDRSLVLIYGRWLGTRWLIEKYRPSTSEVNEGTPITQRAKLERDPLNLNTACDVIEVREAQFDSLPIVSNLTLPKPKTQTLSELIAASPIMKIENVDYSQLSAEDLIDKLRDCAQWPPPLGLSRAVFHYDPDLGVITRLSKRGASKSKCIEASYNCSIPITRLKNQIAARWIWYLKTGRWLDRGIVVTQIDDADPYNLRFVNLQLKLRNGLRRNASNDERMRKKNGLRLANSKFDKWEAQLQLWSSDYYMTASGHYREPPVQIYREVFEYCPYRHDLLYRKLDRSWFASRAEQQRYNKTFRGKSAIFESLSGCKTIWFAGREIFADRVIFSLCMNTDLHDDAISHLDGVVANIAFENLWRQPCTRATASKR